MTTVVVTMKTSNHGCDAAADDDDVVGSTADDAGYDGCSGGAGDDDVIAALAHDLCCRHISSVMHHSMPAPFPELNHDAAELAAKCRWLSLG